MKKLIYILLGSAVLIRAFVFKPLLIQGHSMAPALRDGQLTAANKIIYWFQEPRRGDIVNIWTGRQYVVKRIIGMPGEEISAMDGTLYINGKALPEPYVEHHKPLRVRPGKLPAGHYAVAGDNRPGSVLLVIGRKRILGRVYATRSSSTMRCSAAAGSQEV